MPGQTVAGSGNGVASVRSNGPRSLASAPFNNPITRPMQNRGMPYYFGAVSTETILANLVAALDRVDLGVVLLDRDMRACFVNQRFAEMWSGPREALTTGLRFRTLLEFCANNVRYDVPPDQLPAYLDEREAAVRAGSTPP